MMALFFSNSNLISLLGLGLLLTCTGAVVQRVTLYAGPNQTGESITIDEKLHDLSPGLKFFLNTAQSYCAVGWYDFYPQCDYNGVSTTLGGQGMDGATEKCGPANLTGYTGSVRFTGPSDLSTPALALVQGTYSNKFGGREVLVYERSRGWIGLNQTSAVYSYGGSNWTLYTDDSFRGNSWCYAQTQPGKMINHLVLNATTHIRSVRRGCDSDLVGASGNGGGLGRGSGHHHH